MGLAVGVGRGGQQVDGGRHGRSVPPALPALSDPCQRYCDGRRNHSTEGPARDQLLVAYAPTAGPTVSAYYDRQGCGEQHEQQPNGKVDLTGPDRSGLVG